MQWLKSNSLTSFSFNFVTLKWDWQKHIPYKVIMLRGPEYMCVVQCLIHSKNCSACQHFYYHYHYHHCHLIWELLILSDLVDWTLITYDLLSNNYEFALLLSYFHVDILLMRSKIIIFYCNILLITIKQTNCLKIKW